MSIPSTPPVSPRALTAAWVVWSFEHDAWWGPGQFGYFEDLLKAGVYSETEAKEIEERANRFRSPSDPNERAYPIRIAMALALMQQPRDGVIAPELTVLRALADALVNEVE